MMFTSNQWVLGLVLLQHVSSAISSSHGVGDNAASFSTPGVADLPRRRKITNRARRSADDDGQHNHNRDLGIGSHATVISDAIQTMNKINRIYPTTRGGDGGTGEDAILGEMFPGDARDAGNDTGMGKGKGGSKAPKASKAPTASKAPKASKAPTVSKAPKAACSGKGKGGSSGTKTPTVSKAPKASKAPSGGSKAPKASIRCTEEPSMQPSSEPSKIPTKVPTTGDDTTREDNGLPDEQSNDDSPSPMCGRQANGATCENDLCCSEHGYCGDSYEHCSMGCQSGACYAHHGENIMPADPEGGEGKQNTGGDESKGEATSLPICGGQAGDAICLNEMCCSSHGYCGNGADYCGMGCQSGECYENHHGDNVMLKDPEEGHGQNNEPATGGKQEEMGQGGTEITKDIHHGTGFGDGVGMYAVCLEPEASISNDELLLAVDSEVIVSYQYALNIEPGANLDEVLTFAELQLHNLLVEEKMDCSQVGRRKLQGQFETQCYPQAVVSSPGEVELSNAVCQESEALEGKICRIIAGGFGLFLGSEGGCSVFAYDQIKQIYLQWVKDKMTEESRTSGVPVAIENVPGAAGVVFRGAISDEYRQPSVGGSVSGFKSLATGQDDDDNSITSLGGFFIGFICAGTVAIAYLVTKTVRERRRKPDQDEEYMLEKQESKDLNLFDLEEDLNTSTGSSSIEQPDGVLPSPTASNTGVKFVRVDDEYYNFDHDYGIDTRRLGAEPRLADSYLFDRTLQDERSQNHEGHHSPGGHKKPHFCNSQLCGICCGTVATPHQSGGLCCDIPSMSLPSPAARNNTLQPRNYTTPDTIEF